MKKDFLKKVMFLPGWMDLARLHPEFPGLEIWEEDISFEKSIKAECLIGNSLGCHFALLNWEKNRDSRLILINPLLERKAFPIWMWRWLRYFFSESARHVETEKIKSLKTSFVGMGKARRFLRQDFWSILEKVPAQDVLIVRGGRDRFFCDSFLAKKIKAKKIPFLEISEMGHAWRGEYLKYIEKYI